MITAILLLMIGLSDLVRIRFERSVRQPWILVGSTVLVVGALAIFGLSLDRAWVLFCAAAAAGWVAAMPIRNAAGPRVSLGLLGLAIATTLTLAYGPPSNGSNGFLASVYTEIRLPALKSVTLTSTLSVIAVAIFLTASANLITRAALTLVKQDSAARSADSTDAKSLHILERGQSITSVWPEGQVSALKGGRFIGPLERLLIVAAALAGAPAVIVGLLAAKGIVRFPEISANQDQGAAAETFLIGSLTSWAISAAAIGYIVAVSAT